MFLYLNMPPPTSRRAILIATGSGLLTGLAGCAGITGPRDDAGSPYSSSPTDTASLSGEPLTIDDLAFSVELERQFTPSHPAHLVVGLRNAGDDWIEFIYGPVLFSEFRSDPAGLLIMPDDRSQFSGVSPDEPGETVSFVPETPVDGCWRAPDGSWVINAIGRNANLGPGDVIMEGYTVLDTGGGECLQPDTYRFKQQLDVGKQTAAQINSDVAGETTSVTLTFELNIDVDGSVTATTKPPNID